MEDPRAPRGPGRAPVWQSLGPFPGPFRAPDGPHGALNLGKYQTFLGPGRTLLELVETMYGVWDIWGQSGVLQSPGPRQEPPVWFLKYIFVGCNYLLRYVFSPTKFYLRN